MQKRADYYRLVFVIITALIIAILAFIIFELYPLRLFSASAAVLGQDCLQLGDNTGRMNLVFIADNYENLEEFEQDAESYKQVFLSATPFSENKEKFNFYLITNINTNLSCEKDNYLACNEKQVKKIASSCPNEYIFVLSNQENKKASSAYQGVAVINVNDDKRILIHESGHLLAYLADEYLANSKLSWNAPNCDTPGCKKWNSNPGCFQECMDSEHYRPTEVSVMRNPRQTSDFGIVNERVLLKEMK